MFPQATELLHIIQDFKKKLKDDFNKMVSRTKSQQEAKRREIKRIEQMICTDGQSKQEISFA